MVSYACAVISPIALLLSSPSPVASFVQLALNSRRSPGSFLRETSLLLSENESSQAMSDLFCDQVSQELTASQFYLSASIWFNIRDWEGMASYMLAESSEERGHALQLIDFANKRNIPVQLHGLEAPPTDWNSPEEVWQDALELEQKNTASLLHLAEAATKCQDYAVLACLNPFHMEQVDSEAKISAIIAKVSDENKTPGLLRQLDHELGLEAGET